MLKFFDDRNLLLREKLSRLQTEKIICPYIQSIETYLYTQAERQPGEEWLGPNLFCEGCFDILLLMLSVIQLGNISSRLHNLHYL